MVEVYLYLLECLPQRLPLYKRAILNVYLNVYLFMFFLKRKVYLINWVDFGGDFTQQEKTNKKMPFYSCFSMGVDFLTLLGRHRGLTLFFDISRRNIPCLGRRWPQFAHTHVLFFDFWRLFHEKPNFLKKQIYRPFRAVLRRFLTLPIVMSSGKFPLLRFYRRISA